ncbi:uncharacterized protein LOC117259519 isoform X3 [Epinephelus lanceolatus]
MVQMDYSLLRPSQQRCRSWSLQKTPGRDLDHGGLCCWRRTPVRRYTKAGNEREEQRAKGASWIRRGGRSHQVRTCRGMVREHETDLTATLTQASNCPNTHML